MPFHDDEGGEQVPQSPVPGGAEIFVVPSGRWEAETSHLVGAPAFHQRSLRIALAMRGGVSLAVWIGGAVAELDLLRSLRVTKHGDQVVAHVASDADVLAPALVRRLGAYAVLLAANEYHRVEIDVLAGASAGGLNGVLFAVAQRAGRPFDEVRDVWQTAGSISSLLRPPGFGRVPSLMSGDEYFFPSVLRALRGFYTRPAGSDQLPIGHTAPPWPHPGLVADFVRLDLTATVVNAQDARTAGERAGATGFQFSSLTRGAIPGPQDSEAERDVALGRLALAARSTSSFPGAFEPATIHSPPLGKSTPLLNGRSATTIDMRDAFLLHRDVRPYRVMDGGVLDNIPISRAFRAIGPRLSKSPVSRALYYLDPAPPTTSRRTPSNLEGLTEFFGVIGRAAESRLRVESADEDEAEIREWVNSRWVGSGRLDLFAAVVADSSTQPHTEEVWAERERAYGRARASRDGVMLRRLINRTGRLPFDPTMELRAQVESSSSPSTGWFRDLTDELVRKSNYGVDIQHLIRDATSLVDAASWLVTCVQWLEVATQSSALPPSVDSADLVHAKTMSYAALTAGTRTLNERSAAVARLASVASPVGEVIAAWRSPCDGWGVVDEAIAVLDPILDSWDQLTAPAPWPPEPPAPASDDERYPAYGWWREAPWRHLRAIPLTPRRALRIAPLMETVGEAGVMERPAYERLVGDWKLRPSEGGRLGLVVRELGKARAADLAQTVLRQASTEEQAYAIISADDADVIRARIKLGGARIANFSGFLSQDWRDQDWWWGRVDAAAFLTRVLSPRDADDSGAGANDPASLVVAEMDDRHEQRTDQPGQVDAVNRLTAGVGGLSRVSGEYLHRLVFRGSRLAARAVAGSRNPVAGVAIHGTVRLLAPLLVLAPATVHRQRILAIVGVLLLTFSVVSAATREPLSVTGAVVVLVSTAVVVLTLTAACLRGVHRWRVLAATFPDTELDAGDRAILARRSGRRVTAGVVTAVAASAAAWVGAMWGSATLVTLWLILSFAATVVTIRATTLVAPLFPRPAGERGWWVAVIAILIPLATVTVVGGAWRTFHPRAPVIPASDTAVWQSWIVVVGLTAVAILLTCRVGPWWWCVVVTIIATAAAGVPILISTAFIPGQLAWGWVLAVLAWANVLWLTPSIWHPGAVGGARIDQVAFDKTTGSEARSLAV